MKTIDAALQSALHSLCNYYRGQIVLSASTWFYQPMLYNFISYLPDHTAALNQTWGCTDTQLASV